MASQIASRTQVSGCSVVIRVALITIELTGRKGTHGICNMKEKHLITSQTEYLC